MTNMIFAWRNRAVVGLLALALIGAAGRPATAQAVTTYQYDNGRTGWNRFETTLTPSSVGGTGESASTFGLLSSVPLDAQVDAQPLVVPAVRVLGDPHAGTHDVVYVATEGNTVYAIDPTAATVLLSRNLGTPVPPAPQCGSPAQGVGIMGTPVIDRARHVMYLIAYTQDTGGPTYRLHALNLSTLADNVAPTVIAATQTLTDGTSYAFDPAHTRQRPALLEANGAIYAGFGAFCDAFPSLARGWVMGWSADTLMPLDQTGAGSPTGELTNRLASAPNSWFLSSVWMSGAGLAADTEGVYFITGNADKSGTTYDGVNNIQNSVIKLAFSTAMVLDLFTPQNEPYLDQQDQDFSAGGVMLLPSLGASVPPLATAAGKFGQMFLLNRDHMGGYTPGGPDNVLATETIARCWCVESFYATSLPYVVSSGGNTLTLWQVKLKPSLGLTQVAATSLPQSGTGGGFMTSVSSNGRATPVIWAVFRPSSTSADLMLAAFDGTPAPGAGTLTQLFAAPAGTWTTPKSKPNSIPVVANGRVYVVSNQQLAIFGLGSATP